jgi:GT2 family glycosyltransferase
MNEGASSGDGARESRPVMDRDERSTPLVTTVVLCFNGLEITRQCLKSLSAQKYSGQEIVVIDNGSTEDDCGVLEREFRQIRLIRLDRNLGFAGGCNRGITEARGKYVALLNNDAVATPEWLESMVKAAESDDRIGGVASIVLDGNNPIVLDSLGVGIAVDGMSRQAMKGEYPPVFDKPLQVLVASGCACLYRIEALRRVGGFDDDFFAYCEDTDLGLRLLWAGYKTVAAPGAVVIHHYSKTAGEFSLRKIFWVERNHYWVVLKNFPLPLLFLLPFATLWRCLVQAYTVLFTKNLDGFIQQTSVMMTLRTLLRANIEAASGVPAMWRKRRQGYAYRQIGDVQMIRMLMKFRISLFDIMTGGKRARQRT